MLTLCARTCGIVRSGVLAVIVLLAMSGVVTAGERHAGTVLAVDPAGHALKLDEFGLAAVRRTLDIKLAPDADVVLSERVEPVTDFNRVWRDTPISLGDVRPGDFVVVELGERPGVADRVVVTLRGTGTGS